MILFNTSGNLTVTDHPSREPDNSIFVNPPGLPYSLPFPLQTGAYYSFIDITIFNKTTRETTQIENQSATYSNGGVLSFEVGFTATENEQFYMIINENGTNKLLFNSNLLCTDETDLQDYSIIDGDYKAPPQTDNEIITT